MKNQLQSWIIYAVLLAVIFYLWGQSKNKGDALDRAMNNIEVLKDTVKHYRNANGRIESERLSFQLTAQEYKKQSEELGFENDGLKKKVGNLNNLVSRLQGDLRASGSGSVRIDSVIIDHVSDTTYGFRWTNTYLSLSGRVGKSMLNFDYTYDTKFDVTHYWKRNKGKKSLVVNVELQDPNAQTENLNSVVIQEPPKKFWERTWFHVGVGVIGGYLLTK